MYNASHLYGVAENDHNCRKGRKELQYSGSDRCGNPAFRGSMKAEQVDVIQ